MIGGNVFYDAQTATGDTKTTTESTLKSFSDSIHQRYSVGGTIVTSQAGAFFSIYRGISKGITDYTVANGLGEYDVSDGYDFGLNVLVPGLESINLGVTKYKYSEENQNSKPSEESQDSNVSEEKEGSKYKIEYNPNSFLTFGVQTDHSDNPADDPITSVYMGIKYRFHTPFEQQLEPITNTNSNGLVQPYNEVERDDNITLKLVD